MSEKIKDINQEQLNELFQRLSDLGCVINMPKFVSEELKFVYEVDADGVAEENMDEVYRLCGILTEITQDNVTEL